MNRRHLASTVALGGLLTLAFGSVPSDGGGVKTGKTAVSDLEGKICSGDAPFRLPIDDTDAIWAEIDGKVGSDEGVHVTIDYELIKGEVNKSSGWQTGSAMKASAIEAVGQLCSSETECDGHTCSIEESILATQWQLEFRDGPTEGSWILVGYFMGNLTDDATRKSSVDASLEAHKAAIVAELGDGLPKEEPAAE